MPLGIARLNTLSRYIVAAAPVAQRTASTITAYGSAQLGSTNAFGGTSLQGASATNVQSYLRASSVGTFTSGDFTIEGWFYWSDNADTHMMTITGASGALPGISLYRNYTNLVVYSNGANGGWSSLGTFATNVSTNTWHHISICRNNTLYYASLDGTVTSLGSYTGTISSSGDIDIGGLISSGANNYNTGFMDEIRVSNTARYTTNFTPPSNFFVNDANTLLLVHCDGTVGDTVFIDDNGARASIGVGAFGDAAISTTQYKIGSSSFYVDGTGDYIKTGSYVIPASGTFTIEFWYRSEGLGTVRTLCGQYLGGTANEWTIWQNTNDTINMYYQGAGGHILTSTTGITDLNWHHIAITRNAANRFDLWIDGVLEDNVTESGNLLEYDFMIGARFNGGGPSTTEHANGYFDEVRVSNTVRYTTNFTPSTTAFTNDSNTLLLLHAERVNADTTVIFDDNGGTLPTYTPPVPNYSSDSYSNYLVLAMPFDSTNGIVDVSADIRGSGSNCTVTAGGNSSVTSTLVRYDGQGYAGALQNVNTSATPSITASLTTAIPSSSSGTYVIEGWFKANNATTNGNWALSSADSGGRWLLGINNGTIYTSGNENRIGIGSTDWHHIAIVCDGSGKRLYVDGAYKMAFTTPNTGFSTLHIGQFNAGDNADFQGHIQDLRVYVGTNKGYTGTNTTTTNFDLPGPIIQYFAQAGAVQPFGLGDNAVDLDGTTYIKGNAQPNTALYNTASINTHGAFTLSMWVKVSSSSGGWTSGSGFVWEDFMDGKFPSRWQVEYNQTNKIQFEAYNSAGARIIRTGYNQGTGASAGAISANTWYWLGASYDSAVGSSARVYIAPLNGSPVAQTYYSNATSSQTLITNWNYPTVNTYKDRLGIGARYAGNVQSDCCVADIWYSTEYIDLSILANRQKFITSSGTPANLGAYGQTPTGNLPSLFLAGDASNFHKNLGTLAVPLTVGGGTVTDCANAPGD